MKHRLGLEVHFYFDEIPKLFCPCIYSSKAPENSIVCPYCIGLPGTKPFLQENSQDFINKLSSFHRSLGLPPVEQVIFSRKHYFSHDSPRNIQVGCFFTPFLKGLSVSLPSGKEVRIRGAHFEGDSAKTIYSQNNVFIDLNRAGNLLIELVTEPDFTNPDDIVDFIRIFLLDFSRLFGKKINFRVDVNLSNAVQQRVELKNLNSFQTIKKALQYEFNLSKDLSKVGKFSNEHLTKGFDEGKNKTKTLRIKEVADDYNYIPERELPPFSPSLVGSSLPFFPLIPSLITAGFPRKTIDAIISTEQVSELFALEPELLLSNPKAVGFLLTNSVQVDFGNPNQIFDLIRSGGNLFSLIEDLGDTELPIGIESVVEEGLAKCSHLLKEKKLAFLMGFVKRKINFSRGNVLEVQKFILSKIG